MGSVRATLFGVAGVAALGSMATLGSSGCHRSSPGARAVAASRAPSELADNIDRASYVGSHACEPCHAEVFGSWERSPMHRMTRLAAQAEVGAPFDGTTFHFKDDVAILEAHDGARFVRLNTQRNGSHLYRITRLIGGRIREDFAGVEVSGYADARAAGEEQVMPVSFLLESRTLRYKGYSVMVHERSGLAAGPSYSRTCILCHNTAPYLLDLLGQLGTRRMPPYQGEVVDRLLPPDTRWSYSVSDARGMREAVQAEATLIGVDLSGVDGDVFVRRAVDATRERLGPRQLVEVGIGCESCHGGARDHVRNPAVVPSFEPRAPWLSVRSGGGPRTRAAQINHACARCHQVLFSRYPWTWEGGERHALAGGSNINSGEGRDFLLGGCNGKMSCTTCHDPHARAESEKLARLGTPAGNAICVTCHRELQGVDAQRAHSHHAPDAAGGACIGCHMPRKNMALDGRLTRYHRIGSPTDPLRVLNDRPLECALCHIDKTVRELTLAMEHWWNKAYDRDALAKLYGGLDVRPMVATLERGKPHEQAVALFALGDRHERAAAPVIAERLANEVPLVRQYARDALENALGRRCGVDLAADLGAIERQADGCMTAAGLRPVTWPHAVGSTEGGDQPED